MPSSPRSPQLVDRLEAVEEGLSISPAETRRKTISGRVLAVREKVQLEDPAPVEGLPATRALHRWNAL